MNTTQPFVRLLSAALQLTDFLIHLIHQPDPGHDDGRLTMTRHEQIRRHWLAAGCLPNDDALGLVSYVAGRLRAQLWEVITQAEGVPALGSPQRSNASFAQQESVSEAHLERKRKLNAAQDEVMLGWLMTCPATLLQLAGQWQVVTSCTSRDVARASSYFDEGVVETTWTLVQTADTGRPFRALYQNAIASIHNGTGAPSSE